MYRPEFFSGLIFTTAQVVFITAKIAFRFMALLVFITSLINTRRTMFNSIYVLFSIQLYLIQLIILQEKEDKKEM